MADDPQKRGGQDRTRINVEQAHERRYWTEKFGVPEEVLRRAVATVGVQVDKVEAFLKRDRSSQA
jgi:hypothetical protein